MSEQAAGYLVLILMISIGFNIYMAKIGAEKALTEDPDADYHFASIKSFALWSIKDALMLAVLLKDAVKMAEFLR